ncbi:MAG: Crp/Fnr family transcriptional regulator [Bacteroidota bacterium]|nr:Crp/Fnr family transcriptional regulator [Bacteroidota bacterium]MDP4230791.1 Crp/Fnr family transcriptional regulator [Bacteroidota bacterium]MDP4235912.1 Crp/Fnr family transcriptional regulator [Bacteroidota bacterium]
MNTLFSDELLSRYGAKLVDLDKGEMLFAQGEPATNFYIVKSGRVKMSQFNEQGREFIQGHFSHGETFGEPPFFAKLTYPASALAIEKSEIWKVAYDRFMELLRDHPAIAIGMIEALSDRLIYKSMMLRESAVEEAEHRLETLLKYIKKDHGVPAEKEYLIKLTRQELADMTGLRVETVIRTIKVMEQKGVLEIIEGKIFLLPRKRRIST